MSHSSIKKRLCVLKTVVVNEWLNETPEVIGHIKSHHAKNGDPSTHLSVFTGEL